MISVIIPVYNVKSYLEKCVASVTNQTYRNLEIILVDDGSTDGCGEICDELKRTDERIVVIHQNNQGLSVARNTGIDAAHGEWIAFLDSDDWIQPEMYSELYNITIGYDSDIVSCAMHRCESEDTPIPEMDDRIIVLDDASMIRGLISNEVILFEVWNKLWRRSLIGDVRFIPKQVSEDVHFDRILFTKAEKIVHINKIMYNYRVNRPGNTNSSFKINRLCIFEEFDQWYEDLLKSGKKELAAMMATIAAQFAIHIYEEAIEKGQPNEIKNQLIREYKKNQKKTNRYNFYFGNYRIKARMMSVSPWLYGLFWRIKQK